MTLLSADEHSIRRRVEAGFLAPQFLVALPKVVVVFLFADLVRMRERVDYVGLGVVLDVFLDVLLGDVDILCCILFLVLLLEVAIVLLGRDEPDCDEVVEDNHDQKIQAQHVDS